MMRLKHLSNDDNDKIKKDEALISTQKFLKK